MSLIETILDRAKAFTREYVRENTPTWRWATVVSVDPVRIRYDGTGGVALIPPTVLGTPVNVGDRVQAVTTGGQTRIWHAGSRGDAHVVFPPAYTKTRRSSPARTELTASGQPLAVLTDGAQTGVFLGPERTFEHPAAGPRKITHSHYVHVLPRPYQNGDETGGPISALLADPTSKPDILEVAVQYGTGEPYGVDTSSGLVVAGESHYGAEGEDGSLLVGADFYDYLGIEWRARPPDPAEFQCLDCSGFVRMVYGYRSGMPLGWSASVPGIPRQSKNQANYGVHLAGNGEDFTDPPANLMVGDLVFFDTSLDGTINHVGIYLGVDDQGYERFIHSTPGFDGVTFNSWTNPDTQALITSRMTGAGWYAQRVTKYRRY